MKKLISILTSLGLAVSAYATGDYQPVPTQSGTLTFTPGTLDNTITNSFALPFSVKPVMVFYPITTNCTPITNYLLSTKCFVTSSNFAVASAATNNAVMAWTAYVGSTAIQTGYGAVLAAATPSNQTFSVSYAYTPYVILTPTGSTASTNNPITLSAVTTTNFTALGPATNYFNWISIGTTFNPGATSVTY